LRIFAVQATGSAASCVFLHNVRQPFRYFARKLEDDLLERTFNKVCSIRAALQ
jgi:hypothetical protein